MNMLINKLSIYKKGEKPQLHLKISFTNKEGIDTTKEVYDQIKNFAVITDPRAKRLNVYPGLTMSYGEDNIIEFMETPNDVNAGLKTLPSLLLRDWGVLNQEEMQLLETSIKVNPLVKEQSMGFNDYSTEVKMRR